MNIKKGMKNMMHIEEHAIKDNLLQVKHNMNKIGYYHYYILPGREYLQLKEPSTIFMVFFMNIHLQKMYQGIL